MEEKEQNTIRIISQNVNGIIKDNDYNNLNLELKNIHDTQYDILLNQETNINWNKRGILLKINKYLQSY